MSKLLKWFTILIDNLVTRIINSIFTSLWKVNHNTKKFLSLVIWTKRLSIFDHISNNFVEVINIFYYIIYRTILDIHITSLSCDFIKIGIIHILTTWYNHISKQNRNSDRELFISHFLCGDIIAISSFKEILVTNCFYSYIFWKSLEEIYSIQKTSSILFESKECKYMYIHTHYFSKVFSNYWCST